MNKVWLYRKRDGEGKLFNSKELAIEAEESGEYCDTPASCMCDHSSTGDGIGYVVSEDLIGKNSNEISASFTKDELKLVAKELGIKVDNRQSNETIAQNIIDTINILPTPQEDNKE